jgi:hypothetical protein
MKKALINIELLLDIKIRMKSITKQFFVELF